jgi:hypothetical protein
MTEYSELVEKRRLELSQQAELEDWAKRVKHVHYNNYIEEAVCNNGDVHYTDVRNDKKWTVFARVSTDRLTQRMKKEKNDRKFFNLKL